MKPGRESQTSVLVCMGRALAHGRTSVPKFEDPTAMQLLPERARVRVERVRAGAPTRGLRERFGRRFLEARSDMMAVRTVLIDDAIRSASSPQVVILGAGLDGRAWRMPELRDAVVFEVDHPDTQREKKTRALRLAKIARDVRFVAVDFTRDDLDERLASAGHDPAVPTTWVWEGVVMYLTREEIERSLAVIQARSARGSHLIVVYTSPAPLLVVVRALVRRLGEPIRSAFTADAMRELLARYGFAVTRDDDVRAVGASLGSEIARRVRPMRHLRIVIAERT